MSLEPLRDLTDIGLFVEDLERAIAFYGSTLGFALKRRDIGFAEFRTTGVGLALWEVSDVTQALELAETPRQGISVMVAVRVETADLVDALHDELGGQGRDHRPGADHAFVERAHHLLQRPGRQSLGNLRVG